MRLYGLKKGGAYVSLVKGFVKYKGSTPEIPVTGLFDETIQRMLANEAIALVLSEIDRKLLKQMLAYDAAGVIKVKELLARVEPTEDEVKLAAIKARAAEVKVAREEAAANHKPLIPDTPPRDSTDKTSDKTVGLSADDITETGAPTSLAALNKLNRGDKPVEPKKVEEDEKDLSEVDEDLKDLSEVEDVDEVEEEDNSDIPPTFGDSIIPDGPKRAPKKSKAKSKAKAKPKAKPAGLPKDVPFTESVNGAPVNE